MQAAVISSAVANKMTKFTSEPHTAQTCGSTTSPNGRSIHLALHDNYIELCGPLLFIFQFSIRVLANLELRCIIAR
jgi:hypothetical protein